MCKAFSCIVDRKAKVTWKLGMDSHESLLALTKLKDDTSDPALMTFARVEISPKNNNYLEPDVWEFKIDQKITPSWWMEKHKTDAFAAYKKWLSKLDKILVRQKIVHPFKIEPPAEITKQHINMLRKWASVRASVGASVGASVWASVGASVWDSARDSVGDSVWASVRDSVGASVWDSVWDSVGASVWASVWTYCGSFFILPIWKYINHPRGKYPFAPCVQLWKLGLVPGFDGKIWRLHAHSDARVVFQITAEELKK